MNKIWMSILVFVMMFSLAACGNPTVAPEAPTATEAPAAEAPAAAALPGDPVKIGVVLPLSGTTAYDGQSALNGAKLGAEWVNKNGGVLGRPVELVVEDTATDPAVAASAAEKLINNDKVVALLGAFNSSSTGAVMPLAEKYELPIITAISTSPTLTQQGNKWFFRAVGTSQYFIDSLAKTVIDDLQVKRFAYIYENGDWGRNSVAAFKNAVDNLGGENLTEQVVNATDADLYTQLTAIKDTNPDAIYAVSNLANAVRIAQQARELGITVPIIGEGAWASGDFFTKAGDAAEGIYGMVEYLPEIDTPLNPEFKEMHMAMTGKAPDKYAASDFNAMLVLTDAINRAGSTEPAAIRDALVTTDFEGLMGPIKFASTGQGHGFQMFLSLNKDGKATLAGSALVSVPEESAAAAPAVAAPTGDPIKVGVVLPLSGTTAYDGQSALNGAKLGAEYINANGGILGRPVELVVEDTATDPAVAASAAEKLINNDNVVVLLGAFNSSSTGAVMPLAEKYEIPIVTAISTSPTLTEQGNKWFFRAVGTSKYFIDSLAKTVFDELQVKKIAYIYENGDWGRNSVAAFKTAVPTLGGENLTEQAVNATDADLYTQLTAIKDANPDAIYAVSNLANAVRIAQQARELGITVPIIGEGAWASGDFFTKAGDAAEGIYGMVEYLPEIDTPLNPKFKEMHMAMTGKAPDKYSASDFNAMLVIADAISRAGSTDSAAIRDALAATEFEGLMGPIKFASNGQGYGFQMFLSLNKDGKATLAGSALVSVQE